MNVTSTCTIGNEARDIVLEDASPEIRVLAIVMLLGISVGVLLGNVYFIYYRNNFVVLEKRNLLLLIWLQVGGSFVVYSGLLSIIIGPHRVSCQLFLIFHNIGYLIMAYTACTRLFSLYWRVRYNQKLIGYAYCGIIKGEVSLSSQQNGFQALSSSTGQDSSYYHSFFESTNKKKLKAKGTCTNTKEYVYKILSSTLTTCLCWKPPPNIPERLYLAQLFASKYFAQVMSSFFIGSNSAIVVFLTYGEVPFGVECLGCTLRESFEFLPFTLPLHLLCVLLILFNLYKLRNASDSLGIRKELQFGCILYFIFIQLILIPLTFKSKFFTEQELKGTFYLTLYESLIIFFMFFYILPYQVIITKKKCRFGCTKTNLRNVLSSHEGRKAFYVFLVWNLSLETLAFYEASTTWKMKYGRYTKQQRLDAATQIYQNFIEDQALLMVNISYQTRQKIQDNIALELQINLFEKARNEVFEQMDTDLYPRFTETAFYRAYINETGAEMN